MIGFSSLGHGVESKVVQMRLDTIFSSVRVRNALLLCRASDQELDVFDDLIC